MVGWVSALEAGGGVEVQQGADGWRREGVRPPGQEGVEEGLLRRGFGEGGGEGEAFVCVCAREDGDADEGAGGHEVRGVGC